MTPVKVHDAEGYRFGLLVEQRRSRSKVIVSRHTRFVARIEVQNEAVETLPAEYGPKIRAIIEGNATRYGCTLTAARALGMEVSDEFTR